MDEGLTRARKRYEWSRSTLRSFDRSGNCVAMCQVNTLVTAFRKDTPEEAAAKVAKAEKSIKPDATRVTLLKARTETSRRPATRIKR